MDCENFNDYFFSLCFEGLFRWALWSWFNFGILYLSRKLSISYRYFWGIEYRLLKYALMIFFNFFKIWCYISCFISILLIWILSLFLQVSLVNGLSMVLILSKHKLPGFLFVCFDSLYSSSFPCGWFQPRVWWFPAFYSSWVY